MKLPSTSDSGSINKLAECLFVIPEYCITVVLSVGLQDRNFNAVKIQTHSRFLFKERIDFRAGRLFTIDLSKWLVKLLL